MITLDFPDVAQASRYRRFLEENVWPASSVLTTAPRTAILEPRDTATH